MNKTITIGEYKFRMIDENPDLYLFYNDSLKYAAGPTIYIHPTDSHKDNYTDPAMIALFNRVIELEQEQEKFLKLYKETHCEHHVLNDQSYSTDCIDCSDIAAENDQ